MWFSWSAGRILAPNKHQPFPLPCCCVPIPILVQIQFPFLWECHSHGNCHSLLLLPGYDSTSIYWRLRAGSRRVTWSMVCCAVSNKNKLKVQQIYATKATETETEKWLLMVGAGAQLPTPVVGGVPEYKLGYPWTIPLNTSGEEALTTGSFYHEIGSVPDGPKTAPLHMQA